MRTFKDFKIEKSRTITHLDNESYHKQLQLKEHHFSSSQIKGCLTQNGAEKLISDIELSSLFRKEWENSRYLVGRLIHEYIETGDYSPEIEAKHESMKNPSDYNDCVRVMAGVDSRPDIFFNPNLIREYSLYANLNGLKVKARFDAYDPTTKTLYDYKTVSSVERNKITYAIRTYGYALSLAWYRKIMDAYGFPVEHIQLIFLGKDRPSVHIENIEEKKLQEAEEILSKCVKNLQGQLDKQILT